MRTQECRLIQKQRDVIHPKAIEAGNVFRPPQLHVLVYHTLDFNRIRSRNVFRIDGRTNVQSDVGTAQIYMLQTISWEHENEKLVKI